MIAALVLPRPFRVAFIVDALLAIGAAAYWTFAARAFVRSVFGVAAPDPVHELLAQKGAVPLLFAHGLYGLMLARDREVPARAFSSFHTLLLLADLAFLLLGCEMLGLSHAPEPRSAAIAQVAVSLGRIAMRGAFLWKVRARTPEEIARSIST